MTKEEAKDKFRLADRLFNEQRFGPALKVLTELNAAFPGERHVLYPMARCLTGLGRNAEALDLADRVIREFDYGPAVDLYKRLKSMKTGGGIGMLDSGSDLVLPPGGLTMDSDPVTLGSEFDSLIDRPAARAGAPPPLPAPAGAAWKPVALWIGLALGSFVLFLVAAGTAGRPALEWLAAMQERTAAGKRMDDLFEEIPFGPLAVIVVFGLISHYFLACFPGYWALRIMEALPFNDFGEDMKDVALYTLWGLLLTPLIGIGWLIFLIILRRHYELSAGKQFIVVVLWIAFDIGLSIVYQLVYTLTVGAMIA